LTNVEIMILILNEFVHGNELSVSNPACRKN
jgi:hypothetical protein